MANQYKNKIIYNGESLIDLTSDTVSAATLLNGETAHDKSGAPITGTYVPFTPSGNINITQAGTTNVANYATATVAAGSLIGLPTFNVNPTITINEEGLIEASYEDYSTVSPVYTSGWIDSSESLTAFMYGSNTYQLSTQAATTITPTTSAQTAVAAGKYTTGAVTVAAMPIADPLVDATSGYSTVSGQRKWSFTPNASAGVHYGYDAGYFEGTVVGNEMVYNAIASNTTITPSTSAQTIGGANTMMEGAITVAAMPSGSATAPASISGSSASFDGGTNALTFTKIISVTPEVTAGYVSSGTSRNVTVSLSADIPLRGQNDLTFTNGRVTYPAGFYEQSGYRDLPTGVTTSPTSISGTAATVSTGTNTLTLTKTVSVTPRVTTAGYVSTGTAGNSSVSLTANVTTKAAATITPGTSNQTITSGTYLTGTQTISGDADLVAGNIKTGVNIFGVAGSYTADATAAADDILSGQTAYVNGSKITGTLEVQNFYTGSSTPAANFGNNGDLYLQVTT